MREAYRNGRLTLEGMHRVVQVDVPKGKQLYDFFVKESHVITTETEEISGSAKKARH